MSFLNSDTLDCRRDNLRCMPTMQLSPERLRLAKAYRERKKDRFGGVPYDM